MRQAVDKQIFTNYTTDASWAGLDKDMIKGKVESGILLRLFQEFGHCLATYAAWHKVLGTINKESQTDIITNIRTHHFIENMF